MATRHNGPEGPHVGRAIGAYCCALPSRHSPLLAVRPARRTRRSSRDRDFPSRDDGRAALPIHLAGLPFALEGMDGEAVCEDRARRWGDGVVALDAALAPMTDLPQQLCKARSEY